MAFFLTQNFSQKPLMMNLANEFWKFYVDVWCGIPNAKPGPLLVANAEKQQAKCVAKSSDGFKTIIPGVLGKTTKEAGNDGVFQDVTIFKKVGEKTPASGRSPEMTDNEIAWIYTKHSVPKETSLAVASVWSQKEYTNAEIADITGLSKSTVEKITPLLNKRGTPGHEKCISEFQYNH